MHVTVAAVGAAALVYLNALDNPFVYDDHRMVIENTSIRALADLRSVVLYEIARPIANLSYALDMALWGPSPAGFHATNLLLHLLNVALLARLAWHVAGEAAPAALDSVERRRVVTALGAAMLLAVHPLMASAVGYVAARPELLCAAGCLAALLSGRRWLQNGGWQWGVTTWAAWVFALLSKEVAAVWPLLLILLDGLVLAPVASPRRRVRWAVHGPLLVAMAAAAIVRLVVLLRVEYGGQTEADAALVPVLFDVARRYLGLLLAPSGQSIFHAVPLVGWRDAITWAGVAIVAALLAGAYLLRRAVPLVTLGVLWFLLLLMPSMVLVLFDRAEALAEHRLYGASAGLFLAVGSAVAAAAGRVPAGDRAWARLLTAVGVVVCLALGVRTVVRNAVWASPIAVWTEAMQQAPDHWVPHQALGEALLEAGRRDEAVAEFTTVTQLRPEEPTAYQKLALAHVQAGRRAEATAAFEALRAVSPRSPVAANGLGAMALLAGQRDDARRWFTEALAFDPRDVPARQALAAMAEEPPPDIALALRMCQEIQQIAPRTPGNDECIRRNQARLSAALR